MYLLCIYFLLGGLATVECNVTDFESQLHRKQAVTPNVKESRAVRDCMRLFAGVL